MPTIVIIFAKVQLTTAPGTLIRKVFNNIYNETVICKNHISSVRPPCLKTISLNFFAAIHAAIKKQIQTFLLTRFCSAKISIYQYHHFVIRTV
jgi:hypothetical protein